MAGGLLPLRGMRVRITRQPRGVVDGMSLHYYHAGEAYDLAPELAEYLVAEGFASIEMRQRRAFVTAAGPRSATQPIITSLAFKAYTEDAMIRGLVRLMLVALVVVAAAFYLFGYWSGGREGTTTAIERPPVDKAAAREAGAEIGERAAVAAARVSESLGGRQSHRQDQSEDGARRSGEGACD